MKVRAFRCSVWPVLNKAETGADRRTRTLEVLVDLTIGLGGWPGLNVMGASPFEHDPW